MSISHNKRRNTALLYEFLIRHTSKCLLSNDKKSASKSLAMFKKYFSAGSPIHEELSLFRKILNSKVDNAQLAPKIVEAVCKQSTKIDARKLDEQKSKLIREINYSLGKEVFEYKIPNYTVCASIQILLNESRQKNSRLDSVDKLKLQDSISTYIVKEEKKQTLDDFKLNPEYNDIVYRFAVKRFKEKYADKLTENQKKVLNKYVIYLVSGNQDILKNAIQSEVKSINEKLSNIKDKEILDNKPLMERVHECKTKLATVKNDLSANSVMEVLSFMKLVEELES